MLSPERVFAKSLKTLLARARLRVVENETDPATIPVTRLDRLRDYDCIVLVGDFSDANVQMIRHEGGRVVDTRSDLSQQFDVLARQDRKIDRKTAAGISVVYTGVVPIVYKAQRSLLDSMISSTVWSFLTITPLVMFVTRSPLAGMVMMLPNILPVLMVFGGMGWTGTYVDIGAMMSASIALGVACDDTIHYITWFREDLDRLGDRKAAILSSYSRCATPTTQAAIVNGLGLFVFATSTFMPTRRFGYLMVVILVAGLIAELVMLPALLAGPLGVVFRPKVRKEAGKRKEPTVEALPGRAAVQPVPSGPHSPRLAPSPHSIPHGMPSYSRQIVDYGD